MKRQHYAEVLRQLKDDANPCNAARELDRSAAQLARDAADPAGGPLWREDQSFFAWADALAAAAIRECEARRASTTADTAEYDRIRSRS